MPSTVELSGSNPALVSESDVREGLSLRDAIAGLRGAFEETSAGDLISVPRVRVVPLQKDRAWLHTLRAGATGLGIAGGKDYSSIGFETPAMWMTVVSQRTGSADSRCFPSMTSPGKRHVRRSTRPRAMESRSSISANFTKRPNL